MIRRAHGQSSSELRHGKVILDPNRLTASLDGESLALKPKEFALLELLMRNAGRVLPRKLIEESSTPGTTRSSNAVEVHVHHPRRKLGSDFIRTVHGIGYTLGDMKRLARLSLRLRLTLLFAVLTAAAWGMASVIAWQQTSKKLDKLFDTQQLLFARRLSVMHFDELRAPPALLGERKRYATGTSTTTRWRSPSSPATAKWCL